MLLGAGLLAACGDPAVTGSEIPAKETDTSPTTAAPTDSAYAASLGRIGSFDAPPADALPVVLESSRPFPEAVFTQGLEVDPTNPERFLVSRGLNGESGLGTVDEDGIYTSLNELDEAYFGEGLTVAGDVIYQLTWQAGQAFAYDATTLERLPEQDKTYEGEGWGICAVDDTTVVTSDGSSTLTVRDVSTFAPVATVDVTTAAGQPVDRLNELECANGAVYANRWYQDAIYRIDLDSGAVTQSWQTADLIATEFTPTERARMDVTNGIAHLEGDRFAITGKQWSQIFYVELPLN